MSQQVWLLLGVVVGALLTGGNAYLADRRSVARELRATQHLAYAEVLATAFEYVLIWQRWTGSRGEAQAALDEQQQEVFVALTRACEAARLLCDEQDVEDAVVALHTACTEFALQAARGEDQLSNQDYQTAREGFTTSSQSRTEQEATPTTTHGGRLRHREGRRTSRR